MDVLITYSQFAAVTVLHSFLRQNTKKYKIDFFKVCQPVPTGEFNTIVLVKCKLSLS